MFFFFLDQKKMVRLILVLGAPEMDFDNFSCAYTFKIDILTHFCFVVQILRGFLRISKIPDQIYFIFSKIIVSPTYQILAVGEPILINFRASIRSIPLLSVCNFSWVNFHEDILKNEETWSLFWPKFSPNPNLKANHGSIAWKLKGNIVCIDSTHFLRQETSYPSDCESITVQIAKCILNSAQILKN